MDWNRIAFLRRVFRDAGAPSEVAPVGDTLVDAHWLGVLEGIVRDMRKKTRWNALLSEMRFVVIDMETTGFDPLHDDIISVAATEVVNARITGRHYASLVRLERRDVVPSRVEALTGIGTDPLKDAPPLEVVMKTMMSFIHDDVLVAHHAKLDTAFLGEAVLRLWNVEVSHHVVDTGIVAGILHGTERIPSLDDLLVIYPVPRKNRHRALDDAQMTAEIWVQMIRELLSRKISTFGDLMEMVVSANRFNSV
jgi:DNA polymerase III epsilon subunit family exonuclease